ncbi:MAG: hypothetical protein M1825_002234 [Sarcosagium campestre]|nr:MAG: hypothetical protein M1825_002234 [Sarcosagium campestre]
MGRRKKADARAANSTTVPSASSSRNKKKPTHQHAVSPTNGPTTSSQLPRPPPPFTTALPPALSNLTSITTTSTSSSSSYRLLSPRKLYLIHTDHHPPDFKRRIFLVPLVTNTLILAALVYRVCSILPVYIAIGLATLGVPSSTTSSSSFSSPSPSPSWTGQQASHVTAGSTPWSWKRDDNILGVIVGRAAMFLVDYILYIAVWPWPRAFFFCFSTPGGPLSWRRRLGGFRAREAVVRVSRRWDVELFSEAVDGKEGVSSTTATTAGAVGRLAREIAQFHGKIHDVQGIREGTSWGEKSQQGGLLKERILPALDPAWMRPRTGYMMLSADWDLHFDAMTTLQGLLDCDDSDSSLSYPLKSSSSEESSTATATAAAATATTTTTATPSASATAAEVGAGAEANTVTSANPSANPNAHDSASASANASIKGNTNACTSLASERKQDKAPPKWSDIDSPLLLVHDSNYGGWCVWRLNDDSSGSSSSTTTPGTTTSGTTTAGAAESEAEKRAEKEEEAASRQKMKLIKSRLVAMGKESVFYRWVELLQYEYESSRPPPPQPPPQPTGSDDNKLTSLDDDDGDGEVGGDFDGGGYDSDARKQRQQQKQQQQHDDSTRRQVRELFEKEGIDFDEFWRDVEGGVIGVKG